MNLLLPKTMASKYSKQKLMGENAGQSWYIYNQQGAVYLWNQQIKVIKISKCIEDFINMFISWSYIFVHGYVHTYEVLVSE